MSPYEHEEPDGDEGEGMPEEPDTDAGGDEYKLAGRTIRHALADGDDEALADAICKLIDIHTGEAGKGEEGPKSKPNLAVLLMDKKKGK